MVWANANWHWIRYRCRERTVHAHVHIVRNLRLPVNPICMFSDCSRKPMQTQWSHPNPTKKAPSWLGSLRTARRSCIYWLAERYRPSVGFTDHSHHLSPFAYCPSCSHTDFTWAGQVSSESFILLVFYFICPREQRHPRTDNPLTFYFKVHLVVTSTALENALSLKFHCLQLISVVLVLLWGLTLSWRAILTRTK